MSGRGLTPQHRSSFPSADAPSLRPRYLAQKQRGFASLIEMLNRTFPFPAICCTVRDSLGLQHGAFVSDRTSGSAND